MVNCMVVVVVSSVVIIAVVTVCTKVEDVWLVVDGAVVVVSIEIEVVDAVNAAVVEESKVIDAVVVIVETCAIVEVGISVIDKVVVPCSIVVNAALVEVGVGIVVVGIPVSCDVEKVMVTAVIAVVVGVALVTIDTFENGPIDWVVVVDVAVARKTGVR